MKLYEIALKEGYDTLTSVTLGNQAYDIYLKWLERDESFEMKIGLLGEIPVCYAKLTTNSDILIKTRYMDRMPQGLLCVIDTMASGDGRISYEEFGFGRRFRLIYRDDNYVS